jgi:large subunit ribosomal protein L35
MPKMKTKSGAKKRFRVTAKGKVKAKQSHMRHMQMNKPKSMKRKARGQGLLCDADAKIVLDNFLPYSRTPKKKTSKVQKALKAGKAGA